MKRRELILSSAGLLGPALARAARPCPPSPIGVVGGSSATTTCKPGPSDSYTTNFGANENPISEGGKWINGGVAGLDWNNARTLAGRAFAAALATGYNDPIAVLTTSFGADQFAQGTVSRAPGYSPGVSHEIELLLRFQITPHNARGYEVLWGVDGNCAIVRWNGPLGDYTPLLDGANIGVAVDGDVLRAEIRGGGVRVFKNSTLVAVGPADSTWADGQPGMGFWPKAGATPPSYCWKSYTAGSL